MTTVWASRMKVLRVAWMSAFCLVMIGGTASAPMRDLSVDGQKSAPVSHASPTNQPRGGHSGVGAGEPERHGSSGDVAFVAALSPIPEMGPTPFTRTWSTSSPMPIDDPVRGAGGDFASSRDRGPSSPSGWLGAGGVRNARSSGPMPSANPGSFTTAPRSGDTIVTVPEPMSLLLVGSGLSIFGLFWARRLGTLRKKTADPAR
jgi:hypothetical protein